MPRHSQLTDISINMDPICNGTFLQVSNENAIEAYVGMDIPREDAEIMTNPACKNRFEVEVCGNGIKWQEFYPTLPKYNQTYNLKIGEAVTYNTPVAMTITAMKKNGRSFSFEFQAGGKKSTSIITFSPEGMTVKGRNDDGLEHTEVFARQEPEVFNHHIQGVFNCRLKKVREDINKKNRRFNFGIARKWGGRGLPLPEFFGPFFPPR